MGHHALVFGASGILGWAIVNEILNNYPEKGTYSKVTALSNRPLTREGALWPPADGQRAELNMISGINLTEGTMEDVKGKLQDRVPDIDTVTHIYYFAYQFNPDFPTESEINLGMLRRGFGAAETLAPKLEYVIFPTGTKGYGVHLGNKGPFKAPFVESMGDLPNPYRDELFYYVLGDELNRMQQGKTWKWAEVRCDMVNGFVPHSNPYNMPGLYMNFLSLYKYMHEKGHAAAASATVPYPFPAPSYHGLSIDGGQDIFARFSIHLCLQHEQIPSGDLFNIGDESTARSFAERWPAVCALFGLEGAPPVEPGSKDERRPVKFAESHADQVRKLEEEKGVKLQPIGLEGGLEAWMEHFDFDHHLILDKARSTGFKEELRHDEAWRKVFERYARAKKAYLGSEKVMNGHAP